MDKSTRLALGQTELFIILGVVGAIMLCGLLAFGLLFTAVGRVREAAARTQSNNNMRQCAIAVHNFHGVFNKLPDAAWTGKPVYEQPGEDRTMWFHLLPFVEMDNVFKNNVHNAVCNAYISPSDPFVGQVDGKLDYAGNIRLFGYQTLGNEVANGAVGPTGMPTGTSLAGQLAPTMRCGLTLARIPDGTSNVFMLTTRYADCGSPVKSTFYSAGPTGTILDGGGKVASTGVPKGPSAGGFFGAGAHNMPAAKKSNQATFQIAPSLNDCIADDSVFGHSFSDRGLSVALADASIKSVLPTMSATTYCRALCPSDGYALDLDWTDD
jgi:Protein of unknown function (DUF1559)